ncbi:nitroreductase family protein [Terriglobus roseus]|uniref:Nitroreductase n=1 Tax=Terriglobus roseus TaxID=392734 RepID=A0A1H4J9H6_9BACT|nr:nitroreductase family protein [Terriglobus roseus]SEB42232.1 Nitroreductase [Terriglobus roseus]
MDCIETIRNRRSVRSFSDRSVNAATVQDLIEAASMAPSARNAQPVAFWTFLDADSIEALGHQVKNWIMQHPPNEPFTSPMRPVLSAADYRVFYGAPVLILVLATSRQADTRDACCLAAENLMLAARSAGLGSAWVGIATDYFELPETKRKLAIPESYTVVAPLVLGYPTAWPAPTARRAPEVRWCALPHPSHLA